jgi:transcriptional regulator with XRE-family HTH domain
MTTDPKEGGKQASELRLRYAAQLLKMRLKLGLTQGQASLLVGVHRTYVNKVESGKVNLSLDNLDKFLEVYLDEKGRVSSRARLASNLKAWRGDTYSQEALGLTFGIPRTSLSRIEQASATTSLDQVAVLAGKLGIDAAELLK